VPQTMRQVAQQPTQTAFEQLDVSSPNVVGPLVDAFAAAGYVLRRFWANRLRARLFAYPPCCFFRPILRATNEPARSETCAPLRSKTLTLPRSETRALPRSETRALLPWASSDSRYSRVNDETKAMLASAVREIRVVALPGATPDSPAAGDSPCPLAYPLAMPGLLAASLDIVVFYQ
jgi:hypothetical protein